jgi:hypothetical protein
MFATPSGCVSVQAKRFRQLTTPHNIYKLGSKEDPNFDPQIALDHGMEAAQAKVSVCV